MKKHLTILFSFFFFLASILTGEDYVLAGLNAYSRSDWGAAIESFEQAIGSQSEEKKTALYWLIMAHSSARNYHIALDYADIFLQTYPHDAGAAEVLYQKGRIAHFCRQYNESSDVLQRFMLEYPQHPKAPSAYYWMAENDFDRRLFSDARKTFMHVVNTYPASGKVSAAQYRIYLIDKIMADESSKVAPYDEFAVQPDKAGMYALVAVEPAETPIAKTENVSPDLLTKKDLGAAEQLPAEMQQERDRIAELERRIQILEEKIVLLSDELILQQSKVDEQEKRNEEITAEREKLKEEMIAEQGKLKQELAVEQEKMRQAQLRHEHEERTILLNKLKDRREILEALYGTEQQEGETK